MRVEHLQLRGTVTSRSDTGGMLRVAGDAVLVERGRPRILVIMCPCGCGEELAINLDGQAGPAWRLYRRRGSCTLFPSVWRETGCESHFIVWKDQIYLFGFSEDEAHDERDELSSNGATISRELVLDALSRKSLESVSAIADRLDALPWDVLVVCRRLVAEGTAVEGTRAKRGQFRRR
jgi:hypothetical protein